MWGHPLSDLISLKALFTYSLPCEAFFDRILFLNSLTHLYLNMALCSSMSGTRSYLWHSTYNIATDTIKSEIVADSAHPALPTLPSITHDNSLRYAFSGLNFTTGIGLRMKWSLAQGHSANTWLNWDLNLVQLHSNVCFTLTAESLNQTISTNRVWLAPALAMGRLWLRWLQWSS